MGSSKSKPAPPPSPLFDEPWRRINWGDEQQDLQEVKNYKPQAEGRQLRILLHGPAGAGKSSFTNSVRTVLENKIRTLALVDNTSHASFTKGYTTYKIQKDEPGTFYPFVFNDIMGLESEKGVLEDDVKLALSGHVKEGYTFNPECRLSEESESYNRCPTNNDKVHVLVCVVAADTLATIKQDFMQKIRSIRMEASRLGIPQVAIITKADQNCPEIKKNLQNVYRSKYLKKKMEQFSTDVGIPMNCIFPVRNYHDEIDLDSDINALILSSLRRLIDYGEDYANNKAA